MSDTDVPEITIQPSKGWVALNLKDLWEYRELLYFLTLRDIKVRYKQTVLGAAWAVIQPFMTMVVFTIFFGRLAKIPSDGIPYPIFSYTALVPWIFFANGLLESSKSLVGNSQLVTKVYFPRLVIPLSAVLSGVLDALIAFLVLIGMMAFYGMVPTANVVWLPFFMALACLTCMGAGLWLSALNVQFRDVRYVVPFMTQFWLFATPIAYPTSLLTEPWKTFYGLNPMAGVIEGIRWALLGTDITHTSTILVSTLASIFLFVTGGLYFRKMEQTFGDIV